MRDGCAAAPRRRQRRLGGVPGLMYRVLESELHRLLQTSTCCAPGKAEVCRANHVAGRGSSFAGCSAWRRPPRLMRPAAATPYCKCMLTWM